MAVITVASASGAPGVTTSALALAIAWPRPVVLVDANPGGGSAIDSGYFRGSGLPIDATVVDMAVSHRENRLASDLPQALNWIPQTQVWFLRGMMNHGQARSLESLWPSLSGVLKALERNGQDVIVDVGRLGMEGSPTPLILAADLTLLAVRSNLPALVAASSWASTLRDTMVNTNGIATIGTLLIGPHRPYGTKDVERALQLPITAALEWDPKSAEVYSVGATPQRKFASSPLNRSVRVAVEQIQGALNSSRLALGIGATAP